MTKDFEPSGRAAQIARVLRPLGRKAMSMNQAQAAGKLLGLHWTTVYRLRKRFLEDPVATSVSPKAPGPNAGFKRLDPDVEEVIRNALIRWLPRQRELAHPQLDLTLHIRACCKRAGLNPPSRSTVVRRWALHREEEASRLVDAPGAQVPPGHLVAAEPMELVQIDHTQSDLVVVDERWRKPIGRPWITVAIDIASRCVVGVYIAMERPSAAAVALLLTRVALPKAPWLASIGMDTQWPMYGVPKALHLDNAAEFRSRALRRLCRDKPVGENRCMVPLHVQLENSTLRGVIKRLHFPLEIMLVCVRWYAAYALSLRNLEEMMAERGVLVDHATVHRWSLKMLPVLAKVFRRRKHRVGRSWRVDETYVLVGGQWKYLYRAVDRLGQTVDFLLTARRDVAAARRFFERAIGQHDVPEKITIDKSGANTAAVRGLIADSGAAIELRQSKYLNNLVEQDHRSIKRRIRPMLGFKSFRCAARLIAGIETMHMIKKGQLRCPGGLVFSDADYFYSLALG